jgi:hypothetical protein
MNFSNGLFASNITYTCGAHLTRGNSKRCDNKTKGMKFCYAHRATEDEKTLLIYGTMVKVQMS